MGVSSREPLPFQRRAADRLVLEKVEILENDRGEPSEGRDVDALLLREFHCIEHLAPGRFEPSQHLRHKAGVDVGALDCWTRRAGDLDMLHKLRWGAAPDIEITVCDVVKAQFQRIATGSIETL